MELSAGYADVTRARHMTVLGGSLLGIAVGLALTSRTEVDDSDGYAIVGGALLGFVIGTALAEPLHPERWVPATR